MNRFNNVNLPLFIMRIKLWFFLLLFLISLSTGCIRTRGILDIKGKVIDERTDVLLPGRPIIIHGLVNRDSVTEKVFAGQTSTDTSGRFSYSLNLIKDARYYDFGMVGDSDYVYELRTMGLMEMKENARFLSFAMSKLTPFTIKISRLPGKRDVDTLSVYWDTEGREGKDIYPYKIINFGIKPVLELCWIGRNVVSTINTRVPADKKTRVHWDLIQNGKRLDITDTITCRRDTKNTVSFRY